MNRSHPVPESATSLPQSPQDEADSRTRRYVITMAIRTVCFLLMVLVTPYGWYTWVFGIAAAILPYLAVVAANAIAPTAGREVVSPTQAIDAPSPAPVVDEHPTVLTWHEQRVTRDDEGGAR